VAAHRLYGLRDRGAGGPAPGGEGVTPESDGTPTEAEHLEGRYPDADLDGARTYYFGCLRGAYGHTQAGHFLYAEGPTSYTTGVEQPWAVTRNGRWQHDGLDGSLAPGKDQRQGLVALYHRGGWTALAFWDRSGDSRGNSNSVFLIDRTLAFPEALALARERWPELFERFDFEVVPVE
jgi:hypothetical protein